MSKSEADKYTSESFYAKVDFHHGTSRQGAKSITTDGVNIDKNRVGIFGKGFYITNDPEIASEYADFEEPAYVTVRILARKPRIFVRLEDAEMFFKSYGIALNNDQQKTNLLRSLEFDAVKVKNAEYLVVFEPSQVAVFKIENL